MECLLSRFLREILAVIVISHGTFLTGFTYSFSYIQGNGTSPLSLEEEGVSSFRDSIFNSIGCLISAFTVEFLGRKKTIQLCFVSFIGAGFSSLYFSSPVFTPVSHAVTAISVGAKPVFIIYVLEVSQKNHRGVLISIYMIFSSFGVVCSYVLQYYIQFRFLAVFSIVIALTGLCGTSLLPETKYWYLMQNQIEKAKDSSSWFDSSQTSDDIDKEIDQMRCNSEENRTARRYQNFLIATGLLICRGGCGRVVFALFPYHFYSNFDNSLFRVPMPVMQDLAAFVGTVSFTAVIDLFRRKQLLYFVFVLAASSLCAAQVISLCFPPNTVEHRIILPILLLLYSTVIIGFMEELITLMSAEIVSYYNKRGVILNASYGCSFAVQILYAAVFPLVMRTVGVNYVLLFFLLNNAGLLALNIFYTPETGGKELHEFGLFVTSL